MGKDSSIEWTDHSFNVWWGCTKISEGCTHCYADTMATRYGHKIWGPKADRRFFGPKHWAEPLKWNADAVKSGIRRRVFCASMADVFERHMLPAINARMEEERDRLWEVIRQTPMLDWLLLTKRPENIGEMIPWADGRPENAWKADVSMWPNVWLGTSTENQEQANKRIPELLKVPATVRFLSAEPLLGPVNVVDQPWWDWRYAYDYFKAAYPLAGPPINWIIAGAESGHGARPMDLNWVRELRDQCEVANIAFFFKQDAQNGRKDHVPLLDGRQWMEFPSGALPPRAPVKEH